MRIRTIKPDFFKNEDVAGLKPLTRILFQGLWCMADRRGRLEDRPKRIKAEVLPYDDYDADKGLDELVKCGLIARYEAESKKCLQIHGFERHQRITGKEAETESELPQYQGAKPGKQRGNNGETTETTGREGKGKEGKAAASPFDAPVKDLPKHLHTPRLVAKWAQWQTFRRGYKKPKSWVDMFNEQIEFISKFDEPTAYECLSASLRNGWQGLFEPKTSNAAHHIGTPPPTSSKPIAEMTHAERQAEMVRRGAF